MAISPSYEDLFAVGRAELQLRRPDLFAEPGDVTDLLLAAAAAGADKSVGYAAARFAELFLDTARGDALRALGDDRYGIVAQAAAKALVTLTFNRATAAAGAGTIFTGTIVATLVDTLGNEVQFETLADVTYGAAETGAKTVSARAKVAGAAGNVAIAKITRILTTLWDSTLTVNNTARAAGGAEAESDESYRERVRTFPSTIRRGTIAALEYGARTVPGVASAKVSEGATGLVTVFVADGTGNSNTELNALVQTELENWRAAGTVVQVNSAVLKTVNVFAKLKVKAGLNVAASLTVLQAAITNRMGKLTMGETLYLDELKGALIAVDPDRIFRITFYVDATFGVVLSTDVSAAANEVIRAGSITLAAE